MRAIVLLATLIVSTACSPTLAGHPVEDSLRNPMLAELDEENLARVWNEIADLPPREAALKLREAFTPETIADQTTRYRGVIHKDPPGVTIVTHIDSDTYTATITTTARESLGGLGVRTARDVEFEMKESSITGAVGLASRVQAELESDAYRQYFATEQKRYSKQLAAEGEEATRAAFERDFRPPPIAGVRITPRIIFSRGDCGISAVVVGEGIMGSVSVRAEDSISDSTVKAILPDYEVHVWAETLP